MSMTIPILGGLVGLLGGLFGNSAASSAASNASNAAQGATNAENQLINSSLIPIYNTLLSSYNQNYAPLGSIPGGMLGQAAAGMNYPGTMQNVVAGLSSPQGAQAVTGIPGYQTLANYINYASDPGAFLSGLQGVGGQALGQIQGPTAARQNFSPLFNQAMNLGQLRGATNFNTNAMLGPTASGAAYGPAANFFMNQGMRGLSPQSLGAAMNTLDVSQAQNINNIRNQLGSSLPNLAGALRDQGFQNAAARAQMGSNIAAANQALQGQGFSQAYGMANTLDQLQQARVAQMLSGEQGLAGQNLASAQTGFNMSNALDAQQLQRALAAEQMAGGIDANTMSALSRAASSAQAGQQQYLNNMGQAYGINNDFLNNLISYLGQGRAMLPGIASGIQGLAGMYGNAAQNQANIAANLQQNAPNPFSAALGGFSSLYGLMNPG